ncbi:MAG: hypothetical protein AAF551_05960 [Bacteroidota bacterium]
MKNIGFWSYKFMPTLDGYAVKKKEEDHHKEMSSKQYQELLDIKREKKEKERANKSLYKSIGFCLSLSVVILAFNWKSYGSDELVDLGIVENDLDEIIDIPISKQPPPPPPKAPEVFTIKEVKNEELLEEVEVNLDIEIVEEKTI